MDSFHICYVETGYPHPHGGGGAGTYVQLVGRELVRRGYKVSVVAAWCPHCAPVIHDEGVTVYRLKWKRTLHWYLSKIPLLRVGSLSMRLLEEGWQLYQFLENLHQANPISVAEFSEGGDFWHALRPPFSYLCHLHGSRYTFRRMAGQLVGRGDWYQRRLELFFIRRADWIVSPSQALLNLVMDELGAPLRQTTVIPYPLEPRLAENNPPPTGQATSGKIVHFVARNDPVKGLETLLQAVPLVRREVPGVEFHLFGYEPTALPFVPEGVKCYGFLAKDELFPHYQQADLCVVPSLWDNSPNTIYEAMAAGKPVVGSHVGGIPELIIEGETGLTVPPANPHRLALAITELLLNPKRRIEMGQQGRERIRQIADFQDNVTQRLAIYHQIVDKFSTHNR